MAVIPFSSTGKFNTQTSGVAVSTGTFDQTDLLRIPDVDPMFHMLNDGSALFFRILSMLAKEKPATQPRFEFFEDDKYAIRTTVVGAVADPGVGGSDDIVLSSALAAVNTVMYFPETDQAMIVTAVSGTTVTATWDHQGTTGVAIADGAEIILIGASLPEGADANGGIAILPTKDFSFISFFSQGVNSTDIQELTDMLNGAAQTSNEFRKQTLFLMEQIDQHIRYSSRSSSSHADGQLYYTGGFTNRVTTNDIALSGSLTWEDFNTEFNPIYVPTNSSPTKTLLCGQGLFSQITKISWDHFTAFGTPTFQESLGATVQQIVLDGGGVIDVVLDKHGFAAGTSETNKGFLIDMNNIYLKAFQGFDMTWREVTAPESHTKKFELFSSAGLKVIHEETHAKVAWSA